MKQRMILGISIPLLFAMAAFVIVPSKSQEPPKKAQARPLDEKQFPIADYAAPEPSDPSERAKRHAKGQKYDKSHWGIYPDAQSSMARTHPIDPNLPALPFAESTAVVIGQVTNARAYLSNDKTGVYSVFKVQVDEVIKKRIESITDNRIFN